MKVHTMFRAGLGVVLGLALLAAAPRAEIIEQVLVKVNGEILTKTELESRQVQALRQAGRVFDATTDPTDALLRAALGEITPGLLVTIVDEMLVVQRGKELGYRMGDDQFTSVLASIKADNNLNTDEELQAALDSEGMTMADLRQNLERTMIIQRVQQNEILGRIAVSEEEARRYYDGHLEEFTTPATVTLREIFVAVPGDGTTINVAEDEAARAKAEDLRNRVLAGESFEAIATAASDSASRANGGLIGPLSLGELVPELRQRLSAMKAGEIGESIRTPRGYQILKLESMTPEQTMPFGLAREEISNRVFTDRRMEEFQVLISRLRDQAIIEWKNEELKRAYERGLTLPSPGA
jgi:peptidyl-prolyl cis-trans isomerase SurA